VWFQDEARIGQKNSLTRVWGQTGSRPVAPKDLGFASAYLFGAVCPSQGKANPSPSSGESGANLTSSPGVDHAGEVLDPSASRAARSMAGGALAPYDGIVAGDPVYDLEAISFSERWGLEKIFAITPTPISYTAATPPAPLFYHREAVGKRARNRFLPRFPAGNHGRGIGINHRIRRSDIAARCARLAQNPHPRHARRLRGSPGRLRGATGEHEEAEAEPHRYRGAISAHCHLPSNPSDRGLRIRCRVQLG
jgi:hypothetical protein